MVRWTEIGSISRTTLRIVPSANRARTQGLRGAILAQPRSAGSGRFRRPMGPAVACGCLSPKGELRKPPARLEHRRAVPLQALKRDLCRMSLAQALGSGGAGRSMVSRTPGTSKPVKARGRPPQTNPNNRFAFSFKIKGLTLSLNPASSKSFIQRSGVISG